MATKIMACKLLRKCRKEEVPIGVVAATTQCSKGTTISWYPYLLNLFLDDWKDAQDLGTKMKDVVKQEFLPSKKEPEKIEFD
jgi:hypothetical protein